MNDGDINIKMYIPERGRIESSYCPGCGDVSHSNLPIKYIVESRNKSVIGSNQECEKCGLIWCEVDKNLLCEIEEYAHKINTAIDTDLGKDMFWEHMREVMRLCFKAHDKRELVKRVRSIPRGVSVYEHIWRDIRYLDEKIQFHLDIAAAICQYNFDVDGSK